ncbi:hypothetical protein ABK040_011692 [Willaertia magna]
MFLFLLFLLTALLTIVWIIYWTDLLFYWSDPMICPPSVFPWYTKDKYNEIFKDKPFENTENKFLVVGCGFSGISVSGSLTRNGIPFDVVESQEHIGGNWFSGVYETVHIISSKKTTELKDFPMPEDYPDFPSAKQMLNYFENYCKYFRINERLTLNCEVISLDKINDKFEVTFKFKKTNEIKKFIYKGVIINNGHHWDRRMPKYEGQDNFTGEIIHSKDYHHPKQLENKRVLVIGAGNSGCDVSVEAARFALSSDISMRRGYFFIPRTIMGIPIVELMKSWMPMFLQRLVFINLLRLTTGLNYSKVYHPNLQLPDHLLFEHHPTINSELLQFIKLGKIIPHHDVKRFLGDKKIEFNDGSIIEVDLVVFCTGYKTTIPLLDKFTKKTSEGYPQLFLTIGVPNIKYLYFMGIGQPRYGAGPLLTSASEMLARCIKEQDNVKYPIFDVLASVIGTHFPNAKRSNSKTNDILIDPHVIWKHTRIVTWLVGKSKLLETIGKTIVKLPFKLIDNKEN